MSSGSPEHACATAWQHTYEKAAIVSWLLKSDRSPVTNERLSTRALLPNYALKKVRGSSYATATVGFEEGLT